MHAKANYISMAIISWLSSSIFPSVFTLFCLGTSSSSSSSSNASWGAEAARESCRPISTLINKDLFHNMFLHKDDAACPAKDFYAYNSFIKASKSFPGFGTTGSLTTRKRELAAFLAQISHETSSGWATAPDEPFAWGLCFKEEINPQNDYCDFTNKEWPCYLSKSYKGRCHIQLSWNFNYGPAGRALGFDGLKNPEIVANNSMISLKTALWFWMAEQNLKQSCHDVMVGRCVPTEADVATNRTTGFRVVTNIINDGPKCGIPNDARVNDRIGYFKRYAQLLNVDTVSNLDSTNQKSF